MCIYPALSPAAGRPLPSLGFCCGRCGTFAPVSPEKPMFSFFPLRYNHPSFKELRALQKGQKQPLTSALGSSKTS